MTCFPLLDTSGHRSVFYIASKTHARWRGSDDRTPGDPFPVVRGAEEVAVVSTESLRTYL